MSKYLYEANGGTPYGYFSGRYLYTTSGKASHYMSDSDDKYLYTLTGQAEFYRSGKYWYTMNGQPRWYSVS